MLPTTKFAGKVVNITLVCILADYTVDLITLPIQNRVQLCSIVKELVKLGLRRFRNRSKTPSKVDNAWVTPGSTFLPSHQRLTILAAFLDLQWRKFQRVWG